MNAPFNNDIRAVFASPQSRDIRWLLVELERLSTTPDSSSGKDIDQFRLVARWVRKIRVNPNGCWEWIGKDTLRGYGRAAFARKKTGIHRWFYLLYNGNFDPTLCVLHKCDNPPCCNPAHLFLGTQTENNLDMVRKGRQRQLRGQDRPNARLSEDQVIRIRAMHAAGMCQRAIASEFNIGFKTVNKIVLRQRWKHL